MSVVSKFDREYCVNPKYISQLKENALMDECIYCCIHCPRKDLCVYQCKVERKYECGHLTSLDEFILHFL